MHVEVVRSGAAVPLGACGGGDSSGGTAKSTAVAAAASRSIAVTEQGCSVAATPATGHSGPVTLTVHNAGPIKHEVVVIETPQRAERLLTSNEPDETGAKGELADLAVGATTRLTLTLTPGHHAFVCTVPGHCWSGGNPEMLADFNTR